MKMSKCTVSYVVKTEHMENIRAILLTKLVALIEEDIASSLRREEIACLQAREN